MPVRVTRTSFCWLVVGSGMGIAGIFGGVTVNSHSEACDVIELLTKLKKFCPVENRHEIGRENQDSSGALRNASTSTIFDFWGRTGDISAMEGDFNLEEMSNRL